MSVIDVPGAELERVHDLLQRTRDLLDSTAIKSMGDVIDALGQNDLEKAAYHFEKRWGDGRHVVFKDLEGVRDAAKAVADAFRETDEQTAAALEQPEGGSTPQDAIAAVNDVFEQANAK